MDAARTTPLGRVEVGLAVFAAGSGLLAARLYPVWRDHLYVGCPALTIFGIPCVTCGGTRAAAALVQGHLLEALSWNPLVAIGTATAAALVPLSIPVLAGIATPPRLPAAFSPRVALLLGGMVALNWLYLLIWFRG